MYVLYFISVALHILATIVLLEKIWLTASCLGISGKSRILYATVFTFRYVDSIISFRCCVRISDIFYIFSTILFLLSYIICYSIYGKFRKTYDRNHDTVRIDYLIMSVTFIVLFFDYDCAVSESMIAFSNYLECVAILPQLFMIIKAGKIEKVVLYYLVILAFSCVFSAIHYSINSAPWTEMHGLLFGMTDLMYCGFFLYIWRGKITIRSYYMQDGGKPYNDLCPFREYTDEKKINGSILTNNFYKPNLKECILTLETNDSKFHEEKNSNEKINKVSEPTEKNVEKAHEISSVGVHAVQNTGDLTAKSFQQ